MTKNSLKIHFPVTPGNDGYPPVAVESLFVNSLDDGYIIDSIPFFITEATNGDFVKARLTDHGELWFDEVLQRSTNSLIRAVFFNVNYEDEVVEHLKSKGCGVERFKQFKLIAIDIPSSVSLTNVQQYLKAQVAAGRLDYEEPILRQ